MSNKGTIDLTNLTVFAVDVSVTTMTVSIKRDRDIPEASAHMPSSKLVGGGVKYVVPKGSLKGLVGKRNNVAAVFKDGFQFLGGWCIANNLAEDALRSLERIEASFYTELDEVARRLPELYRQQEEAEPEWAHILKEGQLSEAEFRGRCGFRVGYFTPAAPSASAGSLTNSFGASIASAIPAMLGSVASHAIQVMDKFREDGRFTGRVGKTLTTMVDKLDRYSFLDARIAPVVTILREQVGHIPRVSELDQSATANVLQLLRSISNPQQMLSDADALRRIDAPIAELFAAPAPASESISRIEACLETEEDAQESQPVTVTQPQPAKPVQASLAIGF